MFCPNCGAQLADEAKFCTSCGASVNKIPEPVMPDNAPPVPPYAPPYVTPPEPFAPVAKPKKKPSLTMILIAAAAAVTLIVVLVLCLSGKDGYKDYNDLIDDYFDAAADGDVNDVIELIHPSLISTFESKGYSDYEALDELDEWYSDGYYGRDVANWGLSDTYYPDSDEIAYLGDLLKVHIDNAFVAEVEAMFADGDYDYYDFILICVDGRWYIAEVY